MLSPLLTPLLLPLLLLLLLLHPFTSAHNPFSSLSSPTTNNLQQQPLLKPNNTTTTTTSNPWHRLNNPIIKHTHPPSKSFTLTSSPATDLWRPNSTSNNFTAPYVYRICSVENFSRISVTIVPGGGGNLGIQSRWDQGGIAILFPDKDLKEKKKREEEKEKEKEKVQEDRGKELKKTKKNDRKGSWAWNSWGKKKNDAATAAAADREKNAKYSWIKTGLEWENGGLHLSTVATHAFSDWSLSPVLSSSSSSSSSSAKGGGAKSVSFLVERNTTELWIYNIIKNQRYPLREITWAFLQDRGKKNAEMWVGVYVAKPHYTTRKPDQKLSVEFRDLRIEC